MDITTRAHEVLRKKVDYKSEASTADRICEMYEKISTPIYIEAGDKSKPTKNILK